ncbi:MAG: sortase, partial [Clostridiales bacterium]|nr:sortase [Clostridiales bacterium]
GLAGHNRGAHDYFKGVKDLRNGDLITYETRYGTRTYEVYLMEQISDTDFSYLGTYRDNTLVLITCVIDTPTKRWAVCARELK